MLLRSILFRNYLISIGINSYNSYALEILIAKKLFNFLVGPSNRQIFYLSNFFLRNYNYDENPLFT